MRGLNAVMATTFVLATSSSASAECAWVLWTEMVFAKPGEVRTEWSPFAFPSYDLCTAIIKRKIETMKATPGWEVRGNALSRTIEGELVTTQLRCLPDTIDPRGAKAK